MDAVKSNKTVIENIKEIKIQSAEQTEAVNSIVAGIESINSVVALNSATSEECAASSEELSGQASQLDTLLAQFTLESNGSRSTNNATHFAARKAEAPLNVVISKVPPDMKSLYPA